MIFNTVLVTAILTTTVLACPEANINSIYPCKPVLKIDTITNTITKQDTISKDTIIFNKVYIKDTLLLVDFVNTLSKSTIYESLGKLTANIHQGFLKGYKESSIKIKNDSTKQTNKTK